jgi:hypothetical protein
MLPVIENLALDADEPVNHYWLFVINIRDRRFEVLDSIRSLSDRKLAQTVEDILSCSYIEGPVLRKFSKIYIY